MSIGIGTEPTFAQLREHYDGPPPAPLDGVRARLDPGARANASEYVETVAGRTRLMPTVTVHHADGSTAQLMPSPIRWRPRHRPRRSAASQGKACRGTDLGFLEAKEFEFGNGPYEGMVHGSDVRNSAIEALGAQVALDDAVDEDESPPLSADYAAWCAANGVEPQGPFAP
jgi:hypothetical protein